MKKVIKSKKTKKNNVELRKTLYNSNRKTTRKNKKITKKKPISKKTTRRTIKKTIRRIKRPILTKTLKKRGSRRKIVKKPIHQYFADNSEEDKMVTLVYKVSPGFKLTKRFKIDLNNLNEWIDDITNLRQFFNRYLENEPEIKNQILEQGKTLNFDLALKQNFERLEQNLTTNVKNEKFRICHFIDQSTIFEGLTKIDQDSYNVLIGT